MPLVWANCRPARGATSLATPKRQLGEPPARPACRTRRCAASELVHQLGQRHELAQVHPAQQHHLEVIARLRRRCGCPARPSPAGRRRASGPRARSAAPAARAARARPPRARRRRRAPDRPTRIIMSRTTRESSRHTSRRSWPDSTARSASANARGPSSSTRPR